MIDDRVEDKFGWVDAQLKQHTRKFDNHILALYSDTDEYENKVINGVYIFEEDYIRELISDNYGLCTKEQYDELQHLEISEKQIRKSKNGGTITTYI